MKFIPMLYSTPMVQAVLDKRKTKTRRLKGLEKINDNEPWQFSFSRLEVNKKGELNAVFISDNDEEVICKCPYGNVDDIIWVREAFNIWGAQVKPYVYKATDLTSCGHTWKPGIHMPKEACRIFLKIKSIKVERLHDITEADAIAEGVLPYHHTTWFTNYLKLKQNDWVASS